MRDVYKVEISAKDCPITGCSDLTQEMYYGLAMMEIHIN